MSRRNAVLPIKARLANLLGDQGLVYWTTLATYLAGQCPVSVLLDLVSTFSSAAKSLHNALLFALLSCGKDDDALALKAAQPSKLKMMARSLSPDQQQTILSLANRPFKKPKSVTRNLQVIRPLAKEHRMLLHPALLQLKINRAVMYNVQGWEENGRRDERKGKLDQPFKVSGQVGAYMFEAVEQMLMGILKECKDMALQQSSIQGSTEGQTMVCKLFKKTSNIHTQTGNAVEPDLDVQTMDTDIQPEVQTGHLIDLEALDSVLRNKDGLLGHWYAYRRAKQSNNIITSQESVFKYLEKLQESRETPAENTITVDS